jgi:hypothetical protein
MVGNNYRNPVKYYGAYPATYLKRIHALFPDAQKVLHLFSGVTETGLWPVEHTLDINPDLHPTFVGDAARVHEIDGLSTYDLVLADPPYSHTDAAKYGYKLPNKRQTMLSVANIVAPNGYLVWLDVTLPMFRKVLWSLVGTIGLIRSTNHRVRGIFIFQKNNGGGHETTSE